MKTCNKCKIEKELDQFFKDKNNLTDGHYSICKSCKTTGTMQWREKNKEKYNKAHRQYNADNYYKLRLNRYKITPAQYAEMLNNQKGVCAICLKPPNGIRPLVIDHCHTTGKVRGLLCYGCNRLIVGLDNHPFYDRIINYLKG